MGKNELTAREKFGCRIADGFRSKRNSVLWNCHYDGAVAAFDMQADNKCLLGKQSINPTGMPDCRTCKFYGTKSGECTSVGKCSDKYMMYQPLDKVVLYAINSGENQ